MYIYIYTQAALKNICSVHHTRAHLCRVQAPVDIVAEEQVLRTALSTPLE